MTGRTLSGIVILGGAVYFMARSWIFSQRVRTAEKEPRSTRDDAWMILSGFLVVGWICMMIFEDITGPLAIALGVVAVVVVFGLFHRTGEPS